MAYDNGEGIIFYGVFEYFSGMNEHSARHHF
jgi:hypothetical protein